MKHVASATLLFVLVLASATVWAACPGSCQVVRPVQVQCPTPCPQPCPQTCPQPPPCCPTSVPASIGAGPQLGGLECPDFDPAYAQRMYEQNATIIAVTEFGGQRTTNGNLRDISGEIHNRLVGANAKIMAAYAGCGCLTADLTRAQQIIADLCNDKCFDAVYAKTLSALVKQSLTADELGGTKAVNTTLRQQAQFMTDKESDWAFRLDRWVSDHGYVV